MLVISRKPMERIQIGDSVVVTIMEIRGNAVRIGVDAPRHIHVLRTDLIAEVPADGAHGAIAHRS